jgi:tetratricopeptide (TPR) repeat protein
MPEIEMALPSAQATLLGLPPTKPKITNPFYEATELEKAGNRKGAEAIYLELLNSDFNNSVLMAALGMNYAVAERNGLAHLLLQTSLSNMSNMIDDFKRVGITPKSQDEASLHEFLLVKRSELLNAIGTTYKHENKVKEAREYFEKAQDGLPLNPDIQNNLGTLYINEGKPDDALKHLDAALAIDPQHAQAHWNKSLAYLESGDYTRGWAEYDWGMRAKVRVERSYSKTEIPFWDGSPGKTIIVYGEQGIGDEIMFASVLPDLIRDSKQVVFECHKKLHKLFANSFPTLDIYPTREDEMITWPVKLDGTNRYPFDCKIAIGSIPRFYRPTLESFPGTPFLKPTPASELEWNDRLAALPKKPKIGISWVGGHKKTRVEVRSIHLEALLPILSQDAEFISLQYTPCEDEIAAFEKAHGIHIHQFPEAAYSANYDDCAGLVANCDLVITVCTSLVHLAGSMGVPTWVLTPSRPAWRYRLDLDTMPWYSNNVLFRMSPNSTDWTPVIAEAAAALTDLLNVGAK